jgi:ankyrin repeat protein
MYKSKIIIFYIIFHCFILFSWEKEGIYEASYCGQIERMKKYIQDGVDLNKKDEGGDLPLTLAAIYNQYEAVKLLLENGADVNRKAGYGRTALMQADSVKVIEFLLKNGADIELKDDAGDDALLLASEKCNIKKMEILLNNGMNINQKNNSGQTPLMKVVLNPFTKERIKLEFIKILLDKKADVNLKDKENKTVYIISKERSLNNISKLLLEFGAKEEIFSLDPPSLVQALMNKEYEQAKIMINNGIEINFLSGEFSPLMCSIENVEIMKLLLEKGADVNLKNKMNMTALTMAVMSNKADAVKLLIENKADVNVVSTLNDQTPLMFALQNKNQAIIKMLKEHGAK